MKEVPFLKKRSGANMVYKRVRGWISGRGLRATTAVESVLLEIIGEPLGKPL